MREENWIKRKPGSISGSVVPPPVADGALLLPRGRMQPPAGQPSDDPEHAGSGSVPAYGSGQAPSRLPDSIRAWFKPVLKAAQTETVQTETVLNGTAQTETVQTETVLNGTALNGDRGPRAQPDEAAEGVGREGKAASGRWWNRPGPRVGRVTRRWRFGRHVAWIAAVIVLLATATGTAIALFRLNAVDVKISSSTTGGRGGDGNALAGLTGAALVRAEAAAWIAAQVSRSSIIACDMVMCANLVKAGLPASNVLVIKPGTPDPLGADVVVGTPALRSQFGSRLSTEYAPAVLASFGTGAARVDVRVIAPDGAAAYKLALSRDVAARKQYGAQLIGNSRIALSARAKAELKAGQVDPRLLLILPALASQHPIQVISFADQATGASQGIPLSAVELSGTGRLAGLTSSAYSSWLRSVLMSQRPPFRATVSMVRSNSIVYARFAQPNPLGLLHG